MLRKISRILYLVAGIMSAVFAFTYFVGGIVSVVMGCLPTVKEAIIEGLQNGTISSSMNASPQEIAEYAQVGMIVGGACLFILFILCVANAVFSFLGMKVKNKGISIINIVLGLFSSVEINVAAGILSLIAASKEKGNNETVEAEIVE